METRPRPAADSRVGVQVPRARESSVVPPYNLCPVQCESIIHPGPRPDTNLSPQIQSTE